MSTGLHSQNGNGAPFTLLPALSRQDTLTERDRRWFEASFITLEMAISAGIVRVDTVDGAEIVGRQPKAGANFAGLIFPYTWPGEARPGEFRLRRDEPELEQKPDGTTKEKNKYLSPPGKGGLLYFPPGTPVDWLSDADVPCTIVEGEKKALAMSRFYRERGENRLVIGLPGVWNWRGTVGSTVNGNGKRQPVRGVIPNFDRIAWQERSALILFDANAKTDSSVAAARHLLAVELKRRGAEVLTVDLPRIAGVNGVDDLLGLKGAAFVASVLEKAEDFSLTANGFEERAGAIYWLKNGGIESVQLTNFAAKIVGDVIRDDGTEQSRQYEVSARLCAAQQWRKGTVAADEFEAMKWLGKLLGARAVVFPGQKERASVAIRLLSGEMTERCVVAHTGWRNDGDGWRYYHAGGAISADGLIEAEVELPPQLQPCNFPAPLSGDRLKEAVRAVAFDLPKVAPETIMLPLIGSAVAAVLTEADFSVFLFGYTGTGKSELAALIQAFFGKGYHAKNLPGSWSSTANWLETIAHAAKDLAIVVDDFCPLGSPQEQAKLHAAADRLHRAQGNHSGRGRSRTDGSARPVKPPRGMIISTGEDLPRGQSLRARMAILQVEKNSTNWQQLTLCQKHAREGVYADAMAAFLQWLAKDGRIERLRDQAATKIGELRDNWLKDKSDSHKRSATTLAYLERSWNVWLEFAAACDALDGDEIAGLREAVTDALDAFGRAQNGYQVSENPALRFLELIQAALASGKAHLAATDGGRPPIEDAGGFGWRNDDSADWKAQGDRIGWIDGDDVYLQPDAAYRCAHTMASNGEGLTVASKTLWKRLKEAELLASVGGDDRQMVRKQIGQTRPRVLHLKAEKLSGSLEGKKSGQSGQSGQGRT